MTYLFSCFGEMVNIATCIIFYLNIIVIAEMQQRHISEKVTFKSAQDISQIYIINIYVYICSSEITPLNYVVFVVNNAVFLNDTGPFYT